MKIAYVTTYDSTDIHAWSGLGSHILRALQNIGCQAEVIGGLGERKIWRGMSKLKEVYYARLLSRRYHKYREPAILKDYSAQVMRRLASARCDMVFSPSTLPIAYLQTEKPIVFWTDATFAGMIDFYPGFTNLCPETIKHGNNMEQRALSKCRLAIYSSEWAAQTAIEHYDVDPAKVKVVPFGANMECDRDTSDIARIAAEKTFDVCRLLFLGVDWERKGGDQALAVASMLNQRGIKTELHVVGCPAPPGLPGFVKSHGFISKSSEAGRQVLETLFAQSHFLILPSRAECFGVVFAEASSFGLPSLATQVGGIPTVIQDGKNGWALPVEASAATYCDCIDRYMSSAEDYRALALSSFRQYTERLNWLSAGGQVYNLLREFCT